MFDWIMSRLSQQFTQLSRRSHKMQKTFSGRRGPGVWNIWPADQIWTVTRSFPAHRLILKREKNEREHFLKWDICCESQFVKRSSLKAAKCPTFFVCFSTYYYFNSGKIIQTFCKNADFSKICLNFVPWEQMERCVLFTYYHTVILLVWPFLIQHSVPEVK